MQNPGAMAVRFIVTFVITCVIGVPTENLSPYKLNIIHYNDIHARFDETNLNLVTCDPSISPCEGGFARLYGLVKQLASAQPESLILNAGDTFQGTMWYNVYGWNITQHFINYIPHDAHAIGNHEFDSGLDALIPYLSALNAPVLAANLDASLEPAMMPLFKNSIVVEKLGRKIGIIGVTTTVSQTNFRVGKLKFLNETDAVKRESALLRERGVNIIIVLSHCGFDVDKEIANNAGENIDVIVGGHSHTLLYTGEAPSHEKPADVYPVVVNHTSGHRVLIVQASCFTKYLGQLMILFDDSGNIISWSGEPIYLGPSFPQNTMIVRDLEPFKTEVDKISNDVIGYTNVMLDLNSCYSGECNFGSLICDAFVDKTVSIAKTFGSAEASVCIINSRAIRNSLNPGDVKYGDLFVAMPFNNSVNVFDLKGKFLKAALEKSVSQSWRMVPRFVGPWTLQVSGLRVVFNVSEAAGSRVKSVEVRCPHCRMPRYSPLIMSKVYRIVSIEYLTLGGDGFSDISDHLSNLQVIGVDLKVTEDYFRKQSPIKQEADGRIVVQQ